MQPRSITRQSVTDIFRNLWREHLHWTTEYITGRASDFGDLSYATRRVFENADKFAETLIPYYGNDTSKVFAILLKNHFLVTVKFMADYLANDRASTDADRTEWLKNADEIAELLSSVNPFWMEEEWQRMLYEHINLTVNECLFRLTEQFAGELIDFEAAENQVMEMADYMAQGIIWQFNI